ncbi:hypothetical protein Natoc_4214 (plasmid) [Natronococcus occultus SP4]|uniref:Uncharacterized protein n=1 Tax=Natronococcus occultus SP4 TaxID=694430 RepID=L0K5V7_9EURY|nr:hypothetical protein Natoc_4214 [Natronococcus occultus SP4]
MNFVERLFKRLLTLLKCCNPLTEDGIGSGL